MDGMHKRRRKNPGCETFAQAIGHHENYSLVHPNEDPTIGGIKDTNLEG